MATDIHILITEKEAVSTMDLSDRETPERTMTARPTAYLVKPITIPGLRATIDLALRHFVRTEPLPVEAAAGLPSIR